MTLKWQRGLTLIEMLISLFIGLFLLGGVLAAYLAMRTSTAETLIIGELQNTGRLALNIIANDIAQAGFKGDVPAFSAGQVGVLAAPATDCNPLPGLNAGSFPDDTVSANFVMLSAVRGNGGSAMGCITATVANSDVIQVKRAVGPALTAAQAPRADRFYLRANANQWAIYGGSVSPAPVINNANDWLYQHHVYYVQEQIIDGISVPLLRRARLVNLANPIEHTDMIDGVERVRAYFGIDNNGDGQVNTYIPTNQMPLQTWLQETDVIVAVKLHVLVRAMRPDRRYNNNNSYDLGDGVLFVPNDNFRRMAFSTTVNLYNAAREEFQE